MPPLPPLHHAFLQRALPILRSDPRLLGVAAGGSYAGETVDEFSDLDLVVAVAPEPYPSVLAERMEIAESLGDLLGAFTGEHVGEPRVLICLYGPELLHVDLKFVSADDLADRVEDPVVLWERAAVFTRAFQARAAEYPVPDLQWIEDRFWVWIHYGAARLGRGELFETMDMLAFLRGRVLGPLLLMRRGHRPTGVRRIEALAPEDMPALLRTLANPEPQALADALLASAELYRELRAPHLAGILRREEAEMRSLEYLRWIGYNCVR